MTVGERLKLLRQELKLSQEAMGAQGFVSTPGWIKIESGQRFPSDELIHRLIGWLIKDRYLSMDSAATLLEELLTLKYLDNASAFVRKMAYHYARQLLVDNTRCVSDEPAVYQPRPRRDRQATKKGDKRGG